MRTKRFPAAILMVCVAMLGLLRTPHAQSTQASALSASEQAALEVVRAWIAGWEAKDPEKVAATMAEDVFWAGGFPGNPLGGIWRTRDRFIQQDGGATRGGVKFTVVEELVVGGSAGTAILHRRIDEGGFGPYATLGGRGGPGVLFANGTLFWVKDGKIQVWLDGPITANAPRDQAPPLDTWKAEEQAALDVVKSWVAAWNAKDPDKVASYMADDVQYSSYYPTNIVERGKNQFLQTRRSAIAQGVDMRIAQSLAVGGPRGNAILIQRVDRFSLSGRQREVPTAAFFWIASGKIHTWLDFPLETPPTNAGQPVVR